MVGARSAYDTVRLKYYRAYETYGSGHDEAIAYDSGFALTRS